MIDGLRPYPETKPSGLPWLGNVPAHWEVLRSGSVFREVVQTGFPDLELLSIKSGLGIVRQSSTGRKVRASEDRSQYKRIAPGWLGYNLMNAFFGGIGMSRFEGILSPAYAVAQPKFELNAKFFQYLFHSPVYLTQFNRESYGIMYERNRLYFDRFRRIETLVPHLDEQRLIALFLDWHGAQTAKLIRAKKKIITLLNEQKQAIIHRAVTRGLDPNVRLKPSGIPWLGDVPEGWEVRKLASLFRFVGSGTTPSGPRFYDGGIPWVMSGDLNNGLVKSTKRTVTDAAIKEVSSLRIYPQHSLIVAMYGATIGKTGVLAMEACSNQACCVLASPRTIVNVEYVQMFVNLAKSHLVEQGYGGGQPNINAEIVKALRVPVPPLDQQESILRAVRSGGEDKAIQNANSEIALIQEFRTRLIADVVTGRLDVRAAAASLPENVELEPIDDLVEDDYLIEPVDDAENEEVAA